MTQHEGLLLTLTYRRNAITIHSEHILHESYIAKHKDQDATCQYVENMARQAWIEMSEELERMKNA